MASAVDGRIGSAHADEPSQPAVDRDEQHGLAVARRCASARARQRAGVDARARISNSTLPISTRAPLDEPADALAGRRHELA